MCVVCRVAAHQWSKYGGLQQQKRALGKRNDPTQKGTLGHRLPATPHWFSQPKDSLDRILMEDDAIDQLIDYTYVTPWPPYWRLQ